MDSSEKSAHQPKDTPESTRQVSAPIHPSHQQYAKYRMRRFFPRRRGKTHTGSMRPASFRFINAGRCIACGKGIVLTVVAGEVPKIVPVDIRYWDPPSSFYIKGKHKNHNLVCPDFISKMKQWHSFRASDMYVEGDKEALRKVTSHAEKGSKP